MNALIPIFRLHLRSKLHAQIWRAPCHARFKKQSFALCLVLVATSLQINLGTQASAEYQSPVSEIDAANLIARLRAS